MASEFLVKRLLTQAGVSVLAGLLMSSAVLAEDISGPGDEAGISVGEDSGEPEVSIDPVDPGDWGDGGGDVSEDPSRENNPDGEEGANYRGDDGGSDEGSDGTPDEGAGDDAGDGSDDGVTEDGSEPDVTVDFGWEVPDVEYTLGGEVQDGTVDEGTVDDGAVDDGSVDEGTVDEGVDVDVVVDPVCAECSGMPDVTPEPMETTGVDVTTTDFEAVEDRDGVGMGGNTGHEVSRDVERDGNLGAYMRRIVK